MEDRELENRIGKWRKKGTSAKLEKECNDCIWMWMYCSKTIFFCTLKTTANENLREKKASKQNNENNNNAQITINRFCT